MTRMQTLKGLLRLLRDSGGKIDTRIRVQKEVFLLGICFPETFQTRDFEYHHFGPYSRRLSETLQFAVSSCLVVEEETPFDEGSGSKFCYVLTDRGRDAIDGIDNKDSNFSEWVELLNKFHWRTLELVSTIKYLELNDEIDEPRAFDEALRLKPSTSSFQDEAKMLLRYFH